MATCFRIPLLAALCAAVCACQAGDDEPAAATGGTGGDAVDAGTTARAGAFTCGDGSQITLDWGTDQVVVTLPDGRSATLPKAESASGPEGDAYVGDTVSIEHEGDRVVLRDGGKPAQTCTAVAGASAAAAGGSDAAITMRYACEPDTRVTVFADDSASVALPDGQQVTLSRVAGSAPPVFTGGSLYFSVGDSNAHLSQGDQTNELTCAPA